MLGLVRRAEGIAELAEAGISGVVATDDDAWRDRVIEITGGAPIVAGVDSVGGSASDDVLSLLADDGTLVVFGAMASPTMSLSSGSVIFRQVTVKGFWGSKVSRAMDASARAALIGEVIRGVGDGSVTLPVAAVHSLDEASLAVRANFEPGRVGKLLLRP